MAREISITFALNAALKGGFTAAFQNAASSARGVAAAVREMERSPTGKLGASMLAQREKIRGLSGSLKEAQATLATLKDRELAAGNATAMLARQITQAENRVNNLSGAMKRQLATWKETVASAATAGGSVRELSARYKELAASMERSKKISQSLHANMATADALRNQRADLQGRLLSTAATTASVALPVKLAISAEDTFADLRKVMDAPEDVMRQVFTDAQEMSNRTGKSFEDVINIMTSAAQAGLGKTREELLGVADQAVKMSIAWGVSVEQAGKSMATWRSSMKMTDEQARNTADVINALSNSMNAEAGEIDQIFTRLGPMMKGSGVATQDIAALATAFKAAGAQVEVAGTAMKNFTNVMAAGSSGLTDAKISIYKFLGIDPNELQKQFYADSKGAILRVLEALKNVRPEERNSIAGQLFGQESIAAISPLLNNIELLKESFQIANGDVTGSVDEEYANRMKTTATALSQMTQGFRNLGVNVGKTLLPVVGAVARGISGVVSSVNGFVQRFPRLTSVVMTGGAAIAALAVGTLGLGLVINTMRTSVNSVRGVFLRLAASQITATASTSAFGSASIFAGAGARFFAGGLRSILMATGVGAVLVGLGYGISLLIDNWDTVVSVMASAWNWVTDTWGRLGIFFTELGNNLVAIFPGVWEGICNIAASARDTVVAIWQGIGDFFSTLWNGITSGASLLWQGITGLATWAYNGVCSVWNGAVDFFNGIVSGISGIFSGFFDWVRNNFSWVFKTIDAVSGFIGKITGAVGDAWSKAFGGNKEEQSATPVADSIKEKPLADTGAAMPPPALTQPVAKTANTAGSNSRARSFSQFMKDEEAAKKAGKSGRGSRSRGGGSAGGSATTIVTLAGDNNRPQTLFIPAGSRQPATTMPAVHAARQTASQPRALPRTPDLVAGKTGRKKTAEQSGAINVDLTQQFDLIAQDATAVRKVLESIKPDMEALVRKALEKIQSDKRRTAYAQ